MHLRAKVIALIFLALSALCAMTTAVAQQTSAYTDEELITQYNDFHDELAKYHALWEETTAKANNNQYVDWADVAQQLGMPPSTADDIKERLEQLNYYSSLWSTLDQQRQADGQSIADYMRWILGETANSKGQICTPDSGCSYALTRAKLDYILHSPGKTAPPGDTGNSGSSGPASPRADFYDLSYYVGKLHAQLPSFIHLLYALSYTIGVLLVIISLLRFKEFGESASSRFGRSGLLTSSIAFIVAGTALIYLPSALQAATSTILMDSGDSSLFSYQVLKNKGFSYEDVITPVVDIVKIVGLLAFIRGWLMLSKIGDEQHKGTIFKGMIHVVGGIMAVNILAIYDLMSAVFRRLF